MRTVTVDTNLLQEYWRHQEKRDVVERLLNLAADGRLDLAVTARVREDIPHPPLSSRLNELPELRVEETASVARLGFWVLGRDMLGSDTFVNSCEELTESEVQRGRTPPDWRDWDHVHAHILQGRDVFLTWDGPLLRLADVLRERFGAVIMKPEDFLSDYAT